MVEESSKSEFLERVWKLRDIIQELEEYKNKIISYWNSKKDFDESSKKMWISDAKEFYYQIVGAWQLLDSGIRDDKNLIDYSLDYLNNAKNSFTQSVSELKSDEDNDADELRRTITPVFDRCYEEFKSIIIATRPKIVLTKTPKRVIKKSDKSYRLPCFICGKIAVEFEIGIAMFDDKETLIYNGITHQSSLSKQLSELLFNILNREALSDLHEFMKKHHAYEGLDAYCPECDRIYCWEHYNAREEFDDGFYDCTYGTCPNGHKRMIDD